MRPKRMRYPRVKGPDTRVDLQQDLFVSSQGGCAETQMNPVFCTWGIIKCTCVLTRKEDIHGAASCAPRYKAAMQTQSKCIYICDLQSKRRRQFLAGHDSLYGPMPSPQQTLNLHREGGGGTCRTRAGYHMEDSRLASFQWTPVLS